MTFANDDRDDERLLRRLQNFTARHASHHVPLALVTSGGTAAPLERNCVRYLDNFSTGTRGAHAVEEFCRRGYAVVHLKREGSVAPFGRVLAKTLGCERGGLTFESLGALFDCDFAGEDEDGEFYDADDLGLGPNIDDVLEEQKSSSDGRKSSDPWMYSSNNQSGVDDHTTKTRSQHHRGHPSLNPRLVDSPLVQSTLRAYKNIKNQGLLLTIDFQTVDEYLQKLQLCCEAVNTCGSLALVYLAAAVSDFYVPNEKRVLHKIQSRDYGIKSQASSSVSSSFGDDSENSQNDNAHSNMQIQSDNTLTLTLFPVPKVIPLLRKDWCPKAFVISFKLETDSSILRQKSVMAMERNDVHLVVGNELSTRYEKVFVLSRKNDDFDNGDAADVESDDLPGGFRIAEVTAASGPPAATSAADALEYATIEYVVRHHFRYISSNGATAPDAASAAESTVRHALRAASLHQGRLDDAHKELQRERLKARAAELAWSIGGSLLGMALSYGIARMLHGRQHGVTQ